jgi:hypothetical protein
MHGPNVMAPAQVKAAIRPCTGALRRSRPPAADPTPGWTMESIYLELHVSRSTLYRAMARLNGKEGAS